MFHLARALKERGVLGINGRNALYTLGYNRRQLYPLVDDKLKTKRLAQQAGIAVPELYAVIEIQRQIKDLEALLQPYRDFVIKPASGSGGDGIIVITRRNKGLFRKANGQLVDLALLQHHLSNTLSGMYSLGGQPDKALIEYRVSFDQVFEAISYQGVPDIRIVVFQGVPVMSMVRLPTRMSDGKANLHQGAIGAGIDLATGKTLTAVWRNQIVEEHPDTGNPVTGVQIPGWEKLLELSARCYELTGLGYMGVDLVLDQELGPLILELNARPGLNIQIANNQGLQLRLQQVEREINLLDSIEARVSFARERFAVDSLTT
jgi:alpha-L-glutamate ligase-like protein